IDADRLEGKQPQKLGAEQFRTLATFIRDGMDQFGIPGAAVGIVQNGEVAWTRGFGVRKKGGSKEVEAETLMLAGSATATMTGMLMATAVDADRMDWTTPVDKLLTKHSFGEAPSGEAVTVEDL
ncbi:MAG: serine hydrolase domain-containing protein, partial [Bradymonadaceae bacterium]